MTKDKTIIWIDETNIFSDSVKLEHKLEMELFVNHLKIKPYMCTLKLHNSCVFSHLLDSSPNTFSLQNMRIKW